MKKNRWYDKHEKLADHLEALKVMPKRQLNELLKDLITFARLLHPTLFEDHLFEYPLDLKRRRWYDDDPYLWLVVNGLRFTDDEVIRKVVAFFDKQIGAKKTWVKKPSAKKAVTGKNAVKKSAAKKTAAKVKKVKPAAKPGKAKAKRAVKKTVSGTKVKARVRYSRPA
ncbi:MAG: hypothetical protein JW913_09515 [Chitinispirillaceae bacterium]|nr:hypothetical protein [Chitinispirillaceae bacterium]